MKNDKNKTMDSVKKLEIVYCILLILNAIVEFFDFSKEILLRKNKPIEYSFQKIAFFLQIEMWSSKRIHIVLIKV